MAEQNRTDRNPRGERLGALIPVALVLLAGFVGPAPLAASEPASPVPEVVQGEEEAIMIAAGRWAIERLSTSDVRLDPHRTGGERGGAERVARALGARLGTLEQTRRCGDVMVASTCELLAGALLAIAQPSVSGDEASVRVWAWHESGTLRSPVAESRWELRLRRSGNAWRVVAGG